MGSGQCVGAGSDFRYRLANAYGFLTHYNELKPLYVQFYEVVTGRGLRIPQDTSNWPLATDFLMFGRDEKVSAIRLTAAQYLILQFSLCWPTDCGGCRSCRPICMRRWRKKEYP